MNAPGTLPNPAPQNLLPNVPAVDFLVQWQSLVVAGYRSLWRELAQQSTWSVTMIAPDQFREAGMQDLPCAANDPRNPPLVVLPVKRFHTQAVWFMNLDKYIGFWLAGDRPKIFLCFAEPYSLTALFSFLMYLKARVHTFFSSSRPRVLFYGFQNIHKKLPLPLRISQLLLFKCADAILVAGTEHESVLRAHGFKGRCINLPMWFDPLVFNPAEETGSRRQNTTIGYAGSLLPEKGISQILDAWLDSYRGPLRNRNLTLQNTSLEIAGDGPLKQQVTLQIEALKKLGVNAHYRGPIAAAEMSQFYQSLDILIVPSLTAPHWKEQFGRVIIEAMACGCVVIGSDSGEIPNVIGDPTRIFPENDRLAFLDVLDRAVRLVKMDSQRTRIEMSQKAIKRFGDRAVAATFLAELQTLLSST